MSDELKKSADNMNDAEMQKQTGELTDEELDNVSGGGNGGTTKYCPFCGVDTLVVSISSEIHGEPQHKCSVCENIFGQFSDPIGRHTCHVCGADTIIIRDKFGNRKCAKCKRAWKE